MLLFMLLPFQVLWYNIATFAMGDYNLRNSLHAENMLPRIWIKFKYVHNKVINGLFFTSLQIIFNLQNGGGLVPLYRVTREKRQVGVVKHGQQSIESFKSFGKQKHGKVNSQKLKYRRLKRLNKILFE